jgi:hypothetical protein
MTQQTQQTRSEKVDKEAALYFWVQTLLAKFKDELDRDDSATNMRKLRRMLKHCGDGAGDPPEDEDTNPDPLEPGDPECKPGYTYDPFEKSCVRVDP